MLDGHGWSAPAISAHENPTSSKTREKWGTPWTGADFSARVAGILVFVAVHDAGFGALCHGVCAGHDGGWIFGSCAGDRLFHAGNGAASSAIYQEAGN